MKILCFFLFFFCFFLIACFNKKRHDCWNDINFEKTEKTISKAPIVQSMPLYKYFKIPKSERNRLFKKSIKRDYLKHYKVFFFNDNLRAFVKETKPKKRINALRMYHFARLMGFDFVPPSAIRDKYLVQLFIDRNFNQEIKPFYQSISPIKKSDIFVYFFLFGNYDPSAENVIIGKNCNRLALIDNDAQSLFTYFEYGDFPFLYYEKKGAYPHFSLEDYKNFHLKEVQSLKFDSHKQITEKLENIYPGIDYKKDVYFPSDKNLISNQTIHFVIFLNGFWLKQNFTYYKWIWKDTPTVFSKKTIRKLKKLNRQNLKLILDITDFGGGGGTITWMKKIRNLLFL